MIKDIIIFEMANSHQGDVEHGLDIIKAMGAIARRYKVHAAVKLQYRHYDTFIHPHFKERTDTKHIPRFMSTRLTDEAFGQLIKAIRAEGLYTMSTPFDEESIDLCLKQDLDFIKIASCSAKDWPLLEKVVLCRKPLIISTGGLIIPEIDALYNFFREKQCDFALMHCCAMYPAPPHGLQLDIIDKMRKRYPGVLIGYSGHEDPNNTTIAAMAVAKGAQILERHVALPTETIKINNYSMAPEQADRWVAAIVAARQVCEFSGQKTVPAEEQTSLGSLSRGVYAKRKIQKGETISQEDVFFAMPCQEGQLKSGEIGNGLVATKNYEPLDPVQEIPSPNKREDALHQFVYRIKGMLHEAGIALCPECTLELSHHYGLDRFEEVGCAIVNVINKVYCKKLIIMFPGQQHPTHYHDVKEETFHVLSGHLHLVLDGKEFELEPGQIKTVQQREKHSFSAPDGVIFEEISTHHERADSFYDDPSIAKLDVMIRKTILKCW